MTLTALTVSIPGTLGQLRKAWCVYEHYMQTNPELPPERIYIGACLLRDVWAAPDARRNTEWLRIVNDDTQLLTVLTGIGTITEALNHRAAAIMSGAMPRCNQVGRDISNSRVRIMCSNGQSYPTQAEAAAQLGVAQSSISKLLRGAPGFKSVNGYTFWYAEEQP